MNKIKYAISVGVVLALFVGIFTSVFSFSNNVIQVCNTADGRMFEINGDFPIEKCHGIGHLLEWNIVGPQGPQGPKGDPGNIAASKVVTFWEDYSPSVSGEYKSQIVDASGYKYITFFVSSEGGQNYPVSTELSVDRKDFIKTSSVFGLTEWTTIEREVISPFYRLRTQIDPEQKVTIKAYLTN